MKSVVIFALMVALPLPVSSEDSTSEDSADSVSVMALQFAIPGGRCCCGGTGHAKDAAGGFPVALCNTPSSLAIDIRIRSFLLLRIVDFVVDAVDAVDVSVSEFVVFPPGEHLAF